MKYALLNDMCVQFTFFFVDFVKIRGGVWCSQSGNLPVPGFDNMCFVYISAQAEVHVLFVMSCV